MSQSITQEQLRLSRSKVQGTMKKIGNEICFFPNEEGGFPNRKIITMGYFFNKLFFGKWKIKNAGNPRG